MADLLFETRFENACSNAPLVFDHMEEGSSESIVLVISHLVSLMKDQVNFLVSKGLKAALLGEALKTMFCRQEIFVCADYFRLFDK